MTTFYYVPADGDWSQSLKTYSTVAGQLYDAKVEVEQLRAERDQLHALIRRVIALDDLAQHGAPRAKAKRRAAIGALAEQVDPS